MNPDNASEIILVTLRDVGKPLGTGTLRQETEFTQNKPILDRLHRLQDNGLVDISHTEELPGAASDRQYWKITDEGRNWVDDHRDEITKTTARQVERTLQRTLERVDDLDDDVTGIHGKIDGWQKTMNRRSKRLSRLDSKVDDETERAIEASDESWNKAHAVESRVDEIEADVAELHDEVATVTGRLDELATAIEDEQKAREDAIQRLGDWTKGELGKLQKTARRAREDARKARQRGLLDLLLRKG